MRHLVSKMATRHRDCMPRGARIDGEGLFHHVTGRSHSFAAAFPNPSARDRFVELLEEVVARLAWEIAALAILPNHHHLLLRTPEATLSAGMQLLHGRYAHWLNGRRGTRGPVWGERFHSFVVSSPEQLLNTAVYVDANPVLAGLVDDPSDWRWSTFAANAGVSPPSAWHATWLLDGVAGIEREGYASRVRERCRRVAGR